MIAPNTHLFFLYFMKRCIALLASLTILASNLLVHAADAPADSGETDRLEVTAPATAKVGESVDITVKAVSKDGSVVKNYAGTIFIIVDNDNKATVPYAEGYTFINSDQGSKTFSKGLAFTKEGTFKVVVSDFDKPKIEGSVKVKVTAGTDTATSSGSELVTITSPDDGSTLGSSSFSVVGTTKKNSKVQLFVNGTKALESQTDDKGGFVFQASKVDQAKNILSVKVLDGTNKIIGESTKVNVTIGSEGPAFTSAKLSADTAKAGDKITLTVQAAAGLKAVSATMAEAVTVLKEGTTPGTYTGEFTAPATAGQFPVDISLKNDLGKETVKTAAATLTVEVPAVAFKNVKVETSDKKATFTFEVENEPTDLQKFQFTYSTGSGAAKTALTSEKAKIKTASGAYTWYIGGLEIAKYDVTIAGVGADGKTLSGVTSEVIPVDLALGSAGKCMINDVSGLKVTKQQDSSVLTWDAIPEAASYNVYKKTASGEFVMIESVPTNTYTIHITAGPVKYEDFSIKAVCADKTESAKFSPTTKVQTGPAQLILLLSLALAAAFAFTRRRKA